MCLCLDLEKITNLCLNSNLFFMEVPFLPEFIPSFSPKGTGKVALRRESTENVLDEAGKELDLVFSKLLVR